MKFFFQAGNTLYKKVVYLRQAAFLAPRVQDEMSEEMAEETLLSHQENGSGNSG
jgi:hypothetical protein